MKTPLISVIIPIHKGGYFIKNTLNSVLNQTIKDFEIIIIDNAFLNNAKQLSDSYKDKRIKYFPCEKTSLNSIRNFGIEKAKGKYIGFLEVDNIWEPEKLEKQANILENKPQIGLVYCGTKIINENNKIVGKKTLICHRGNVFNKLVVHNFLHNCSVSLFRKNCLQYTGVFDETIKEMTDWEFYLRFAINYDFWGIDEYLTGVRLNNEKLKNDFLYFETCGFKILNKIFQRTDIDIKHLKHINSAYAMRYGYIGKRYLEKECIEKSRGYFREALKRDFLACCRSDVLAYYFLSYLAHKKDISGKKSFKK